MAAASVLFSKRFLLLALAVCAALHVACLRSRRITPALPDVAVATTDSFQPNGGYPGEPFAHAAGVRAWGSRSGSDDNTGTLTIGPFAAPRILRFGASGYPGKSGNEWRVELVGTTQRRELENHPIGERWEIIHLELPENWVDRQIRIVAADNARDISGWLALTEPIRGGRGDGNNALLESFAAWSLNGWLLGVVFLAGARVLFAHRSLAPHWIPLGAGAIVALCGYAAFWLYFANALLGVVFSWGVIAAALIVAAIYDQRRNGRRPWLPKSEAAERDPCRYEETGAVAEMATVVKLMLGVGAFHLALLHLFPVPHDFYTLAANRYREGMPGDNMLSHGLAERLFASLPAKNPADAWRSSDRPPLQAGWQLLTWPAGKLLRLDRRNVSGTSAVWFQLLWVAGAYGLLRTLAVPRARAAGWIAAFAITGFIAQNTVFTWPKLAAGAFACGTFALLVLPGARGSFVNPNQATPHGRTSTLWAAFFGALGWLSHGGVAFSFLALLPFIVHQALRSSNLLGYSKLHFPPEPNESSNLIGYSSAETGRVWLRAGAVFAALALPWMAYQKFYDPPGNQLLKQHLADPRKLRRN